MFFGRGAARPPAPEELGRITETIRRLWSGTPAAERRHIRVKDAPARAGYGDLRRLALPAVEPKSSSIRWEALAS